MFLYYIYKIYILYNYIYNYIILYILYIILYIIFSIIAIIFIPGPGSLNRNSMSSYRQKETNSLAGPLKNL